MNNNDKAIRIDVDAVLRERLPRHYRLIPKALIRWVERVVCQRQMNEMLEANRGRRGADFCRGVLEHLDVTYSVEGQENLDPGNPRVIIVCNHPLGGLDGMMLIDYVTRRYGRPIRFLVNDLLMAIEPLSDVFLPINKHGSQSRQGAAEIDAAMESDAPIIIFPAGLVSRKGQKGRIADLEWRTTFINRAIKHRRDIIPAYFSGRNSKFFYNFAKLRTKLGLKFNIEMIRLPREVFRASGQRFTIRFGAKIPFATLRGGSQARSEADGVRQACYSMESRD